MGLPGRSVYPEVTIHRGLGDGTFKAAERYGAGDDPFTAAIGDLNHDGSLDLAVANQYGESVSVLINTRDGNRTVSADLACAPTFGILPFATNLTVTVGNNHTGLVRQVAMRLEIELAGGLIIPDWRAGYANIGPGASHSTSWPQTLPALAPLVGGNVFRIAAMDVTPFPYNQPPFPPAGDTDRGHCTVTGVAP